MGNLSERTDTNNGVSESFGYDALNEINHFDGDERVIIKDERDFGRMRRYRMLGRLVTLIAGTIGVSWFGAFCYVIVVSLRSPIYPIHSSGNVIPWNNHGTIHYVTSFDANLLDKLWSSAWIIIAVGFIGVGLLRGRQMFDRR